MTAIFNAGNCSKKWKEAAERIGWVIILFGF